MQAGREINPADVLGTPENAAYYSEGRHPGVATALAWLAFSHLPDGLKAYARPFYQAAIELVDVVPTDSAELTTALNKLVEAKDWSVRAGIRTTTGRPGPMARPATVVDPPMFGAAQVPARPDQILGGAGNFGPGQPRPATVVDPPVFEQRAFNQPRPIRDNPQA